MPINPNDADRLLAGKVEATDPELGKLAGGLARLRDGLVEPIGEATQRRHLAAMVEAASQAGVAPAVIKRRRGSRRAFKVLVAATVGLMGTTTALAGTGNLPDGMQHAVSTAVDNVGIHVPNPTHPPRPTPHSNGVGADDGKTFENNSHAPAPGQSNGHNAGPGNNHRSDGHGSDDTATPKPTHRNESAVARTPQPAKTAQPEHTPHADAAASDEDHRGRG